MTNAWPWWEKSKATALTGSMIASEVSLILKFNRSSAAQKRNLFPMHLKKNWACDHLKTSNLSAENFNKILDLDGSIPESATRSGDTGQRIPCFDSCQLIITWICNIRLHLASQTTIYSQKCEIKHWLPCGADGWTVSRLGGVPSRDYQTF